MNQFACLIRTSTPGGEARYALGDPLVDSYLAFVAGRSRPNTLRAVAHDLKTFFTVIDKDPVDVVEADVFDFVADQRGDRTVVRISDGESGLSARTIARRLSATTRSCERVNLPNPHRAPARSFAALTPYGRPTTEASFWVPVRSGQDDVLGGRYVCARNGTHT